MNKLSREDLMSLEVYAQQRADYRAGVMAHKKTRRVALGPKYQVQEVLRIEKIFDAAAIDEELAAYNPLIPDGANWKATFMLEFEDEAERRAELARLIGVERAIRARVGGHDAVAPIANEDLVRETDEKTSAVHFLRFELSADMVAAAKAGAEIRFSVDHPHYTHAGGRVPAAIAQSLAADLDSRH